MILAVGATGSLGGRIARQLFARGKTVRILLRHNSPSEALAGQGMATSAGRSSRRARSPFTAI